MTITEAFNQYASNLNISERQENKVSNCRTNVVREIGEKLRLHSERSKVIGSWDRNTLIRYLSEGDVDIMIILHYGDNKDWDTPAGTISALDTFKKVLDDAYSNTVKRRDVNCITMQLSEFRLDIVPAFKLDTGRYKIPDSIKQRWIETDPFSFAKLITDVNKTMGNSFVPLIKMVKGWNREVGSPIKSFHLECILYNRYKTYEKGYSYDSMLKYFFQDLASYLNIPCYDPITGERVDSYLDNSTTPTKREIAINKASMAAKKSLEAYNDQEKYPTLAHNAWKELLGEFFPA
ncbi:hypothetical protein A2801_03160 [Candidatus Woesebacteria bacterium RIFCSPHIGHO2_01_FULL_41_10]|uniref:Nucleotidyltransferase n=1 Tax=Candidatus Woesebacteria bacterium RIFCSPHIGHO2_01_FULL_41_10 TaxID=1802500 RepID=A0A1F7YS03_9BACT|nr:MAG: hypothetical protein A2801_03160 [Candidatus Woesebacteria bacterium RIFCSPHIGHO2_01_FULL_41_10]